jgi:hypothetical protein
MNYLINTCVLWEYVKKTPDRKHHQKVSNRLSKIKKGWQKPAFFVCDKI